MGARKVVSKLLYGSTGQSTEGAGPKRRSRPNQRPAGHVLVTSAALEAAASGPIPEWPNLRQLGVFQERRADKVFGVPPQEIEHVSMENPPNALLACKPQRMQGVYVVLP